MPVYVPGGCVDMDWNHMCMTAHTHLNFLADWMVNNSGVSSFGDLCIDLAKATRLPAFLAWFGIIVYKTIKGE